MVHITIQQENAFQSNNEIPPHTENLHPTQTTISVGMDMGGVEGLSFTAGQHFCFWKTKWTFFKIQELNFQITSKFQPWEYNQSTPNTMQKRHLHSMFIASLFIIAWIYKIWKHSKYPRTDKLIRSYGISRV